MRHIPKDKVIEFMKEANLTIYDPHYVDEWYNRFESPVRVWSHSDGRRRIVLRRMFPKQFKYLKLDTNLNNPEYYNKKKYREW